MTAPFCDACCLSRKHLPSLSELGLDSAILEVPANAKDARSPSKQGVLAMRRTVAISTEKNATYDNLRSALVAARLECDIVVLTGDNEMILKRILESPDHLLIDVIRVDLISISMFKQTLVRQAISKGIMLEICINQLLDIDNRAKYISNARHIVRTFVRRSKGATNLVLSIGARNEMELRSVDEIKSIAAILGLNERDAILSISTSANRLTSRAYFRRVAFLESRPKNAVFTASSQLDSFKGVVKSAKRLAKDPPEASEAKKRALLWNSS